MKINYQMELTRRDVTPAQFLAYIRSQAKKHDIPFGMELDYFTKGDGSDSHYIGGTPETRPCESETCKALPCDHQTYVRAFDGSVFNEIIEFTYDTETTGHGYYYTISADGEPDDAERIRTSTINYHARKIEQNARKIEKNTAEINETQNGIDRGYRDEKVAGYYIENLKHENDRMTRENDEHRAAIDELTETDPTDPTDNPDTETITDTETTTEKKEDETMTTTEKIIAYFRENEDTFCECIEQLDSWNGYLGDDRYYMMEELDEFYHDTPASELLARAYYGHDEDSYTVDQYDQRHYDAFNPNREYFRYNGYGNLISTDYKDYSDHLDQYAINEMADHRDNIDAIDDNPDLAELFDELEAEKETA